MNQFSDTTILIAEDYAASRRATGDFLRRQGFGVIEVPSGREALRLATLLRPDIAVIDVKLGDMRGAELAAQLKEAPATATMPILLVSPSDISLEERLKALDSGVDACLVKPIESDELLASVRVLVRLKEAEESRKEAEESYRVLFERCPLPALKLDAATWSFLDVNEAATRCYGYSSDEFSALTLKDVRPAEELLGLEDYISRVPDALSKVGRWRHRRKDGSTVEMEIACHELKLKHRRLLVMIGNQPESSVAGAAEGRDDADRPSSLSKSADGNP